ncbi:MAG: ABC transporter permease [Verrucomicrobia bacterium]|jgi:ABC-type transport system involved in multi-copper enzyme maturation permease subunit|nr:ABC transporter permease [Verrucomicrobiota bacterium]
MQSLLAIAMLTWRAAFRFRLFVVVAALLLGAVIGLPILLKDDGTVRGFTQILLTYTLGVITALLGLSTLWLACGILARDIEDCQMQMVVVKPVSRWQIWLGKWLGIVSLNAALLVLSGACVFGLLQWRASKLPADQQRVLRNEVLVSRGSARPVSRLLDIEAETERRLQERLAASPDAQANLAEVRRQIFETVKADHQIVPAGAYRWWKVDLGSAARTLNGRPLHLRVKFNAAQSSPSGTFQGAWQVGVLDTPQLWQSGPRSLAPDTFHEIEVPPDLIGPDGVMTIVFLNLSETALLFPIEDGVEVLYRQGGFVLNYLRALLVLFCWMAVLASLGLAASSFLSFPVASLVSVALLVLTFSSSTMALVVSEGSVLGSDGSTKGMGSSVIDAMAVPVFKALLSVIELAKDYSPIDAVSTGRSVSWGTVGRAFLNIVVVLGGSLALGGMFLFSRREMATAQANQ